MIQQIGVKAIIENNGKILLIKRSKKYEEINDIWDIPGGRIEFGEEPLEGLKREIAEETGLQLEEVQQILDTSTIYKNEERHIVRITYLCSVKEGNVQLSDEHTGVEWCPISTITERTFKDHLLQKTIDKKYKKNN